MSPTRQIHKKTTEIRSPKLRLNSTQPPTKRSIRFPEERAKYPRIGRSDAKLMEKKTWKLGNDGRYLEMGREMGKRPIPKIYQNLNPS